MSELDTWIPIEETSIRHIGCEGVKVMYTLFDEYTEGNVGMTSVRFLFEDGTESEYYHPPKDTVK